jgi:nitrate/nitrite-specific signal transduction histidine kinase
MSGDPKGLSRADLLAKQAAFFESYFRKGAEFTRELMEETQRLRARLAELEVRLEGEGRDTELEERYQQIERENNDLAALYVAQSQLHSTLDVGEVVQVLVEVLLNFVGAERFALLFYDDDRLYPLGLHGIEASELPTDGIKPEDLSPVALSGGVDIQGIDGRPISERPTISIGMVGSEGKAIGAVCIWGFLRQKKELATVDMQIFDLIASSAAMALEAARVATEARLHQTVDNSRSAFASLSRLLEDK